MWEDKTDAQLEVSDTQFEVSDAPHCQILQAAASMTVVYIHNVEDWGGGGMLLR